MAAITLGDISREHRRSFPDRIAVIDGKGRQTWPEFDDRTNQVAHMLSDLGVGAGDRVLWMAQSSGCFLELLVGCAKLGAMVCPVNWRQSAEELCFVIEDFTPRVIVWQEEEIGEAVAGARAASAHDATWLQFDGEGEGSYEHAVLSAPADDRGGRRRGRRPGAGHLHGGHHRPPQRLAVDPPQPARDGHGDRPDHRADHSGASSSTRARCSTSGTSSSRPCRSSSTAAPTSSSGASTRPRCCTSSPTSGRPRPS